MNRMMQVALAPNFQVWIAYTRPEKSGLHLPEQAGPKTKSEEEYQI